MFRFRTVLLPLLLIATAGLLAGCSDEASDPLSGNDTAADNYATMDFSEPYGGLTASDENVAFGDESLQMMMLAEDEELVDDPVAGDPAVVALEAAGDEPYDAGDTGRPVFTFVRLTWGMLRAPEDSTRVEAPCDITDWTGDIHTDRGYLVVRRVLRFERPADHIVFPRLNPQTVALVSHTACGADGVLLQIIERPVDEAAADYEPNVLHINLGPYEARFEVPELAGTDEVVEIDDLGNRVHLVGFRLSDVTVCPKGFLSGRYTYVPENSTAANTGDAEHLGDYVGAWTSVTGRIKGFLRGGYGLDENGARVFFGKYIDRRGRFSGLIEGTWEPAGQEIDLASFSGHWVGDGGRAEGRLGGNAYPVEGYPGGFFAGRWATFCDQQAVDEIE